jgi:hypothetical protein
MKATKHTLVITVEVLDFLSAAALIDEASMIIQSETPNGKISKTDGDNVSWETKTKKVDI